MKMFLTNKQISKSNPLKGYLFGLLITLAGTLFFLVNAKGLSGVPGLLLISILLMVTPTLFYIFSERCSFNRAQSLSLLVIPLFALQYIYYLQAGVPVGFTDPHRHIFTYCSLFSDAGKIIFENVQSISLNFVGLYLFFRSLSLINNIDIITLAGVIPPFLNILIVLTVYLVVNRVHEHRTGLLAAMLYGWEHMVHILGQELRTQTIGVLILFTVIALLLIINKKTARSGVFAAIILLAGLVTTSFVVNFYAFIVFTGAAAAVLIMLLFKRNLDWFVVNLLSIGLYLSFLAFYAFYLLHISKGFDSLLAQFVQLLMNTLAQAQSSAFGNIITKSILLVFLGIAVLIAFGVLYMLVKKVTKWRPLTCFCLTTGLLFLTSFCFLIYTGTSAVVVVSARHYLCGMMSLAQEQANGYGEIYSKFVTFGTYLTWCLLTITYIYYFVVVIRNWGKNPKAVIFFTAYSALLAFCLVNRLNSPLNPGRVYAVVLILLAAAMAHFLYHIPGLVKFRHGQVVMKIAAVSLILCLISANVVKKPDYIIGNKTPFQVVQGSGDRVSYWYRDSGQYLASDFLGENAAGRKVFACMLMQRYPFLISTDKNNLTPLYGIGTKAENLKNQKGSLVLLEDKINGKTFYDRDSLPDAGELDQTVQMMKIYTNDDYFLYMVKQ